jgi:hypothetical protein
MSELSKDEVIAVLGPRVSDVVIAEIVATGITIDELRAALHRVVTDQKAHYPGPALEPGHISTVVSILERLHKGRLLGEAGSTLT